MPAVKDKVVTWWIQNIIVPKQEIIDKPGFVVTTFTEKKFTTYLREFFIPEKLFENIENIIVEKYGKQGKQTLYSAGKKFGYTYAAMSKFTTVKNSSAEEITKFSYLLVRYIEGTYAQQAEHVAEVEQKRFTINFDNYIVCRHNGKGHIMTEGGITGIWSYGMQDNTIEGIQLECQGRGNRRCFVICAPENQIQEKTKDFYRERNLVELKPDNVYNKMNEIQKTIYVKNSLKDLLNAGFFTYERGILSYKNHRFFHCESHILYLLENEIIKLPDGENILFRACFEYGNILAKDSNDKEFIKFIPDFFSALGFGDILVAESGKISIHFRYFPWTIYSKECKFIILRGIMSGFISGVLGRNIVFNKVNVDIGKNLSVTVTE
ncbi:MAG: hypothetical protein JXA00_04335 [Candidatus Thermoplasmatota archaeon]|nr:hypothetical protein [Candidatus Thermoplasmatota archaeon]